MVANIPGGSSPKDTSFEEIRDDGGRGGNDGCTTFGADQDNEGLIRIKENFEEEGGRGSVESLEKPTTTPSTICDKNLSNTQGDEKATLSNGRAASTDKNECTFRRGKFVIHNIKGTILVTSRKTRGKLKNEMHGWKYV